MTTIPATAPTTAEAIIAKTDGLLSTLDGQLVVSQNRWVDHLLDLYNLVGSSPLRRAIEDALSEIRLLRSVDGEWLREQVLQIAFAVEVESAFAPLTLPSR